jgi:hypothetical protein
MIGGDEAVVERLRPIFETLAPAPDRGWGRVGAVGSGHYTKMIHNGIEYGLMQAYAEGFSILQHKSEFKLDLHQVAEIWRYGSVVRSWLLDLTSNWACPHPSLRCHCSNACVPATPIRLPTNSCRPCATNSAATRSKKSRSSGAPQALGISALWRLTASPSPLLSSLKTMVDTMVNVPSAHSAR